MPPSEDCKGHNAGARGAALDHDDIRIGRHRIEPLDLGAAPFEREPLVDIALVGDLAAIDRGGILQQERAGVRLRTPDARSSIGEPLFLRVANRRVSRSRQSARERRHQPLAAGVIGDDQQAEFAIRPAMTRPARRGSWPPWHPPAGAHIDPGAGPELEVLADTAVEHEALRGASASAKRSASPGLKKPPRRSRSGRSGRPVARRDVRAAHARLELVAARHELELTPGGGTPTSGAVEQE